MLARMNCCKAFARFRGDASAGPGATLMRDSAPVLSGAPKPDPRVVRGAIAAAVRRSWTHSDVFATALPSVRLTDASAVGKQKARAIRAALQEWSQVRSAVQKILCGQIVDLGPRHQYPILLGPVRGLDPSSALTQADTWSPPGGWEDLVLGRGTDVLAWSSTHDSISVFPAEFLDNEAGHTPDFSIQVRVEGEPLSAALVAELLA